MRRAAAVASGDRLRDSTSNALISDKCAVTGRPAAAVSTALAANINNGTYNGSTSRDSIIPPLRNPTVNATPTAPSR